MAAPTENGFQQLAEQAGLRYVNDAEPGICRQHCGRGFTYRYPSGQVVSAARQRARIEALAIPPAWTEVWICRTARGHLQSTGYDDRRRKQYLYHEKWHEVANLSKFEHLLDFGHSLPLIRKTVQKDLRLRKPCRKKLSAIIVRLLDLTAIRIGNREYERDNNSVGLTTLKGKHLTIRGSTMEFEFIGKGGLLRQTSLTDRQMAGHLSRLQVRGESPLFEVRAGNGDGKGAREEPIAVTSADVNEYLQSITGERTTAKDFRTWRGSVIVARELAEAWSLETSRGSRRVVLRAIDCAADVLGNTRTVCRKYYSHPRLAESYTAGTLGEMLARFTPGRNEWLSHDEQRLLHLLEQFST